MTVLEQIQASVANGLARPGIESLLGRKLTASEYQEYKKLRTIKKLKDLKSKSDKPKRAKDGTYGGSNNIRANVVYDEASEIYSRMEQRRSKINWDRRNEAERDVVKWVNTYCIGLLLDESPSPLGEEILRTMYRSILDNKPYLIEIARGYGKTSYVECVLSFVLSTGVKKFPVLISKSTTGAENILNDIYRMFSDIDTPFSNDYPDVCAPFTINTSIKRRQLYNGIPTEIQKTMSKIVLARLTEKDGTQLPTSNSCIETRGITGSIRGLKHNTLRPDCVFLDDIQDDESAASASTVEKLYDIIYKTVFNLSGKGKMSVMMAATPICSDDLVERLEKDGNWRVSKFPAIIDFPKDIVEHPKDGLWAKYFKIYDEENVIDTDHKSSLEFYIKNRQTMDDGSKVLNPKMYKESDGHISALQALLEKRHQIGEYAFSSEYQMNPKRISYVINITPRIVANHINPFLKHKVVPENYIQTYCAFDLNTSYGITCTITSFRPDSTSAVIHHYIYLTKIDQSLNEVQYNQKVYDELCRVMRIIKDYNIPITGVIVDAGGKNFTAVTEWCKNCAGLFGIPACAMVGRASTNFNPLVKSRLRNAVGRTVLCGDENEHLKSLSGQRWMFFDSDYFREVVQRAFVCEIGSPGSCNLYDALKAEHSEFGVQICNETLKYKRLKQTGQIEYEWKSKEPHDYLDTMSMSYAMACFNGISGTIVTESNKDVSPQRLNLIRQLMAKKQKVRIV